MKIYYYSDKHSVYVVGNKQYRKLGRWSPNYGPFPSHPDVFGTWGIDDGYYQLPDLYAILLGDKCEI